MADPRATAAKILSQVCLQQQSLRNSLEAAKPNFKDKRDFALCQELCYGVIRFYFSLSFYVNSLSSRPLKDASIFALLLVGIYQLRHLHTPAYAAVNATTQACVKLKKTSAKGLINAVMRNYLRQVESLAAKVPNLEIQFEHPAWLIQELQQAWPEHWQRILAHNQHHAPLSLRVNNLATTRQTYLNKLLSQQIKAKPIAATLSGIEMETPQHVTELPGFAAGEFSVQDGAAQLAAPLLNLTSNLEVLDACSAPGGKASHILELEPSTKLTVVDSDMNRMQTLQQNFARLKLTAKYCVADLSNDTAWAKGKTFARILADVPCSATGVIRRHPDIKLLRHPEDIEQLQRLQLKILQNLWLLLKPGGELLYTTCSVLPQENEEVVERFATMVSDLTVVPITAAWGHALKYGRQILPGENNMDGFYFCSLQKSLS